MINIKINYVIIFFIFLVALQSGICIDIYRNIGPSVVLVLANDSEDEPLCQGTGFFINRAGYVISNLHNINGSNNVCVTTADGHIYPAKSVLAKDISSDLVCFSVDISPDLIHPIILNVTSPEIGEDIFVVGYAEGPGEPTQSMTRGIVSSVQILDDFGEVIQIDASVSPGASGSPLVNMKGEAIGVTTFGYIKEDFEKPN